MRPNPRDTSINSTAVQAQSIADPTVDFGFHAPLRRVVSVTPCRSDLEDHSPPVFCARLAEVVPAESVNIKFFLRGRGLAISRSVGAEICECVDPAVRHLQRGPAANRACGLRHVWVLRSPGKHRSDRGIMSCLGFILRGNKSRPTRCF